MLQYLRELTEKALASEVFAVRTALAPGELDGQARSAHILVLDIQMPEQSGIALARPFPGRIPTVRSYLSAALCATSATFTMCPMWRWS